MLPTHLFFSRGDRESEKRRGERVRWANLWLALHCRYIEDSVYCEWLNVKTGGKTGVWVSLGQNSMDFTTDINVSERIQRFIELKKRQ